MAFDGTQKFTYDGWNRLVSVAHAYRDGAGTLQSGQANVTMSYDGRGRRIGKSITNAGAWDCTYHYYYDSDSLIETRNGSDIPVKHHVWGTRYIDELVQTTVLASEELEIEEDVHYWACQDSNYNVLGVVDEDAVLVERYEYTPYGQRTVLFSPGVNDVGLYSPTQTSRRGLSVKGEALPHGICEVGHQGLIHDEEIGLVYNRARQLHVSLGRFIQKDQSDVVLSSTPADPRCNVVVGLPDHDPLPEGGSSAPYCADGRGTLLPIRRKTNGQWEVVGLRCILCLDMGCRNPNWGNEHPNQTACRPVEHQITVETPDGPVPELHWVCSCDNAKDQRPIFAVPVKKTKPTAPD